MKQSRNGQAAILSSQDLDNLIAALPAGPHRVLATILRFSASRVSESRQLRWRHVTKDWLIYPAEITKTKETRSIPMSPQLFAVLTEWKTQQGGGTDDFICPGRFGEAITRQAFDKAFRRACTQCGVKGASSHSFRRTQLTEANRAGLSLEFIRSVSGHQNLSSLQRYLSVDDNDRRKVVDAFA